MRRADVPPGRPLRVLLVEDSENDAMLLLRELRRGGYEPFFERVYTPEDMEKALEKAKKRGEAFEVVISDYYMPRFRAPDALDLLRRLGYDMPFIVVSSKIGEDAAVGIMKAGADDYLTKENMRRLCPAIERGLGEAEVRRERERAEEALVRSEDRFRRLVEQIPAVTYVQEPMGSDNPKAITYISPQYEAMLGYAPEAGMLDEEHWLKVVHPADRERVLAEEVRTDQTGEPYRVEYRQIARDGSVVWVRDQATLVRDGAGRPLYWLGVQYDITEQKEAVEALRESEERFRLLADEAVEGIVLSENGKVFDANKSFTRMFGYGLEELVETDATELVMPEDRESVAQRAASGNTEAYETWALRKDGKAFPIEVRPRQLPYKGRRVRLTSVMDLTEREIAQRALREAEKRFRTIIEQSPLSIQILAPEGRTLQVNRAWEELWGVTLEDIAGYNILEDRQLVEKGLMPYIERGFAGERTVIPPVLYDPQETIPDLTSNAEPGRWVRALIYPVEDEAGNIREVILMHEDITERRRGEEALRQSEERFRATFEQAAVGMAQVDLDGGWYRVNQKLCEIVGYTAEELRGLTFQDITHPDDLGSDLEYVGQLLDGEIETYSMEKRYFHKDGSIVWIDLTVSLVRASSGDPRYFVSVIEDITERKRTEEALNQSEELYRTVVEQAAENIFLVDAETKRVLEANAALQTSLGYTAEKIQRMTLYDIVAHDRQSIDRNVGRIMAEGSFYLGERQYRRKDGTLAEVEVSVSAVPYDGKRALCIVAHDVTERKRAERALEEIREAERNRIARELHDSTLQDIVYALQEMQIAQAVSEDGAPDLEEAAEALRRSVEGLRGAIFELRLEETADRSFVSSLENLVDLNRRMARDRYELELVVEDDFSSGLTGRVGRELTRIVQEALTNVRRHAEARHARVRMGLDGEVAYVEVSDDGHGFATGSARIGFGRHSMHQRAQRIGGELRVESEPGEGTRVRFRIPISRLTQG